MKRDVVLSIQGRQRYGEQEPETIELVTGGTMEFRDGGWDITYEESELTGLAGVVTTFRVEPGKVTLNREGALICPLLHQLDQKGRLDWLVFTNDDRQHAKILLYHVSIFLQLYHKREKKQKRVGCAEHFGRPGSLPAFPISKLHSKDRGIFYIFQRNSRDIVALENGFVAGKVY